MLQYSTTPEKIDNTKGQCIISQITNNEEFVQKGAHIYYSYYEKGKYINNLLNFIQEGLEKRHKLVIIEKVEFIKEVTAKLASKGYKKSEIESVVFIENTQYYLCNNKFDVATTIKNFERLVNQFIQEGWFIRAWGQVLFKEDEPILSKLREYEFRVERVVEETRYIIVCAFNGLTVPSYIQNELLKTHRFFMTDDHVMPSPFYEANFSTIDDQVRMEKLDEEIILLQNKNKRLQKINDEIKMKKAVIEKSEKFYRNLINELPISIIITKQDKIVYVNHSGIKKFESQNIHGKSFSTLFAKTTTPSNNGLTEYQLLQDADDNKFFGVKSISIWFEGERALLHVLIDLTEQKMNEKLMVRSEKLSIAGELAAGIAHEIRNPLTAIKGFIKLLESTSNEFYLSIINNEISRIEQISSELLMLARPHTETIKTHDVILLLNNVIALLGTQAIIKNIEIELIAAQDGIFIECEDTKIRQVFINIIKNAIEVMDKGKIEIRVNKVDDQVQVEIADQGAGMSQEVLDRIGEPFYTTKEIGTGLGLMVCYKIVGNHNGTIDVKSEQGVGTTFTITLPVSYPL